jgi:hypothetical protein
MLFAHAKQGEHDHITPNQEDSEQPVIRIAQDLL